MVLVPALNPKGAHSQVVHSEARFPSKSDRAIGRRRTSDRDRQEEDQDGEGEDRKTHKSSAYVSLFHLMKFLLKYIIVCIIFLSVVLHIIDCMEIHCISHSTLQQEYLYSLLKSYILFTITLNTNM